MLVCENGRSESNTFLWAEIKYLSFSFIFHLTWMKVEIADAHKNIFIYCSFLQNRLIESHIVSRDVSKFKCLCYKFIFLIVWNKL